MRGSLRRAEVKAVFAAKTAFVTPWFCARWRDNGLGGSRVAFALSRANGKAVIRNLCKRRFRELVRRELKRDSVDLVVLTRRPLATLDRGTWAREAKMIVRACAGRHRENRRRGA